MMVLLSGSGRESFPAALETAGIMFEKIPIRPPPGAPGTIAIWNGSGDILQFVEHAIPWVSIATVLVAWIRAKAARKIIVTTKAGKVIHTEGFSVEQFEKILADAEEITVIDLNELDTK